LSRFDARVAQGGRLQGIRFFASGVKLLLNINIPLRFAPPVESARHERKYVVDVLEVRSFKLYCRTT
jgi:hypothetical protein